ncbi:HPr family phosphocarrier protein, partial [Halomonas marinisediminis]
AFVSTANQCLHDSLAVNALIAFSGCNNAHLSQLNTLTELVINKTIGSLVDRSAVELIDIFNPDTQITNNPMSDSVDDNRAVFKIRNAHGLHARPGAMLVACAKK